MINYKLRLVTPCSSYVAEEMTPKSQLCACSFQDSLRQKNWALEQIREFPDTIGYVWTAKNDSNTLRVDAKIFASAKKYLRKKKFPDICGHGLKQRQRRRQRECHKFPYLVGKNNSFARPARAFFTFVHFFVPNRITVTGSIKHWYWLK